MLPYRLLIFTILITLNTYAQKVYELRSPDGDIEAVLYPDEFSQGRLYNVKLHSNDRDITIDTIIWEGILGHTNPVAKTRVVQIPVDTLGGLRDSTIVSQDTFLIEWEGQAIIIKDEMDWDSIADYGINFAYDSCANDAYLIYSSSSNYDLDTNLTFFSSKFCGWEPLLESDNSFRTSKTDPYGNNINYIWQITEGKRFLLEESAELHNQCAKETLTYSYSKNKTDTTSYIILLDSMEMADLLFEFQLQGSPGTELLIYSCPANTLRMAIVDSLRKVKQAYPSLATSPDKNQIFRYDQEKNQLYFVIKGSQYTLVEKVSEEKDRTYQLILLSRNTTNTLNLSKIKGDVSLEDLLVNYYDNLKIQGE